MLRFAQPDMGSLDQLRVDALVLPLFDEQRPFRGALSLVDWRLAGVISRRVLAGFFSGARGEHLLVGTQGKFPFRRVFVLGAGSAATLDEAAFEGLLRATFDLLAGVSAHDAACDLPGVGARIDADWAAARVMEGLTKAEDLDELTVLVAQEVARTMGASVERERRRAQSEFPPQR